MAPPIGPRGVRQRAEGPHVRPHDERHRGARVLRGAAPPGADVRAPYPSIWRAVRSKPPRPSVRSFRDEAPPGRPSTQGAAESGAAVWAAARARSRSTSDHRAVVGDPIPSQRAKSPSRALERTSRARAVRPSTGGRAPGFVQRSERNSCTIRPLRAVVRDPRGAGAPARGGRTGKGGASRAPGSRGGSGAPRRTPRPRLRGSCCSSTPAGVELRCEAHRAEALRVRVRPG